MIQISQLKLAPDHSREDMVRRIARTLKAREEDILGWEIVKKSIDARKKPEIFFVYTVWVRMKQEKAAVKRARNQNVSLVTPAAYRMPEPGTEPLRHRPVIIGSGPAGLFCGLMLARQGYRPVILERGRAVDERVRDVEAFWQGGPLNPESNVQFGEGGAGTFSDGKLNTLVKDPDGRGRLVLKTFVEAGAAPDILYMQKPHIGTDVLRNVVVHIREEIRELGGEFHFQAKVTDILTEKGCLRGLTVNGEQEIEAQAVVLAVGHSARDTFEMLWRRQVPMEAKAFAMGLRIEHPQRMIQLARYGEGPYEKCLPAADYKVTHRAGNGRGIYSFCMCPGGYVVNASSEPGRLAVNGMSYRARDGVNANSAMIVTVTPADFAAYCPERPQLSGMEFQRQLEGLAWKLCGGRIPVQLLRDFEAGRDSVGLGDVEPQMKGGWDFGNLRSILPSWISEAMVEGVHAFDRQIPGFARPDAVFSGVESRTSSPVRILRNEQCESPVAGLYPCGEGAGYAGGITSAAMDGCKVAEQIVKRFTISYD